MLKCIYNSLKLNSCGYLQTFSYVLLMLLVNKPDDTNMDEKFLFLIYSTIEQCRICFSAISAPFPNDFPWFRNQAWS